MPGDALSITVVLRLDPGQVMAFIQTEGGRDVMRRANNVRTAAIRNMRSMGVGAKVGTGTLMGSIVVEPFTANGLPAARIGSRLDYAVYVHEGHGVIVPRRASILRWPATRSGEFSAPSPRRRYKGGATEAYVYARRVRPVAGKPFLREALPAALD